MLIELLPVSPFMSNCYILGCEETKQGVILDPGDDVARIAHRVEWMGLTVVFVAATHGHVDHIGAAAEAARRFDAPFYMHPEDHFLARVVGQKALMFGLRPSDPPPLDHPLADGDTLAFGRLALKVIHTPGHSPGGVCFLSDGILFTGDTLFQGSVGRTDFEGGDLDELMASIRNRILTLPDETPVFPGHGPNTTVGDERRSNPFLIDPGFP